MPPLEFAAVVLITLALVFYSVGVWAERIRRYLAPWHVAAFWLMLAHAIWATRIVRKGSEEQRTRFHRLSLVVWTIWLVPYFGGMYLGMTG